MSYVKTDHPYLHLFKDVLCRVWVDPDIEFSCFVCRAYVAECAAAHNDKSLEKLRQIRMLFKADCDICERTDCKENHFALMLYSFVIDDFPCRHFIGSKLWLIENESADARSTVDTCCASCVILFERHFCAVTDAAIYTKLFADAESI